EEGATLGGGYLLHQGVHRWGISMSRSGESYVSVVTASKQPSRAMRLVTAKWESSAPALGADDCTGGALG
ncbi:MAG: hypothetical protein M1134_01130, partial [Actinobacteria bacterium]|nr:hypothetical protein [Actinomycetota bacterium]